MNMEKIIALMLGLICAVSIGENEYAQADYKNQDIIRLHVIANSDSESDQNIKYKVKTKVEEYLKELLSDVDNKKEAEEVLKSNEMDIRKIVEEVYKDTNFEVCYKKAELYPIKMINEKVMIQGLYDTYKIVLGNGEGHNWWCIMYPDLAFSKETYSIKEIKDTDEVKKTYKLKIFEKKA